MPWYLLGWLACCVVELGTRSAELVAGLFGCWVCKAEEEESWIAGWVAVICMLC
jgi:hypothetical protein